MAIGKDAVFLEKELNLKCVCFKEQLCKIGIPENRLEFYIEKLDRRNISYVVYTFDSINEKLILKYRNDGVYHNEKASNKNCLICKGTKCYKEE